MKRKINTIAIIGSGVMGSRIACHFANIGCNVLLYDIVPKEALDSSNKSERNAIVDGALKTALKSNPSPIYNKKFANRITTLNLTDDLAQLENCDWIMEAVVEKLSIKQEVFTKIEQHRKPGTLISSNTSGIPIHSMLAGRSDDFKSHFCGTHFFNPPRYLNLLEIIPTASTAQEVVDFLMDYGRRFLGKTTVLCKDTPAFIANRIGVFSIMGLFHMMDEFNLTVTDVDKLTGPVLGRPKSATFRTADVVGLDTLVLVANGLKEHTPDDESNDLFNLPDYVQHMIEKEWVGSKAGQGFYKKEKDSNGKKLIKALNLKTLSYELQKKQRFETLEATKQIDSLEERMPILFNGKDEAGKFYRKSFCALFQYASNRIPEVSDELYRIDDALRAGFGWQQGPFEAWDSIGIAAGIKAMEKLGFKPNQWILDMLDAGISAFYTIKDGKRFYYDIGSKSYREIPGQDSVLSLDVLTQTSTIWKNSGTTITDLGNGVINLAFNTKMNTIGGEVLQGINKAIDLAEAEYKGLVISNTGDHFSAGANVGMIFMFAVEQEWDELDFAIRHFQNTMMRVRYSSIPVVVAPHNMALGGACEMSMHADKVIAHSELYMGLVEFGVGLIPGGGGTKEFAVRLGDELKDGDIRTNQLRNRFLTVGQAKVSTSAEEAFELGYLRKGVDEIIVDRSRQLAYAKQAVLTMHEKGYTRPIERTDVEVVGKEGLGIVYVGANSMKSGNYISEHDQLISEKLGTVMCGGALSERQQVSEQYLLDLERKAFLELCMQRKTLERIQSIITTGKVLRN